MVGRFIGGERKRRRRMGSSSFSRGFRARRRKSILTCSSTLQSGGIRSYAIPNFIICKSNLTHTVDFPVLMFVGVGRFILVLELVSWSFWRLGFVLLGVVWMSFFFLKV